MEINKWVKCPKCGNTDQDQMLFAMDEKNHRCGVRCAKCKDAKGGPAWIKWVSAADYASFRNPPPPILKWMRTASDKEFVLAVTRFVIHYKGSKLTDDEVRQEVEKKLSERVHAYGLERVKVEAKAEPKAEKKEEKVPVTVGAEEDPFDGGRPIR